MKRLTPSQLTAFARTIGFIDWELLRQQKEILTGVIDQYRLSRTYEGLTGILHLIGALQNDAEQANLWVHPGPEGE